MSAIPGAGARHSLRSKEHHEKREPTKRHEERRRIKVLRWTAEAAVTPALMAQAAVSKTTV